MSIKDLVILGTSSQQPTRTRNHGAYLLRLNNEGFLFDPGEGTQRQFIFADISPTTITRIFISHFHGDHCLGLGSMLMRLNLDKVDHPIHCYYPFSGRKNFKALRYGCIYHEHIQVIEHPIKKSGVVHDDGSFTVTAEFLNHGIDTIGYRITEADRLKFDKEKLQQFGIKGAEIRVLQQEGSIEKNKKRVSITDVSWLRKGDSFAYIMDTRPSPKLVKLAKGAKTLLSESTYLEEHKELAQKHLHMTAKEAALIAKEAGVERLVLSHFSARYTDSSLFEKEAKELFANTFAATDLARFSL